MVFYTNKPYQRDAGEKSGRLNNFLAFCVIYAYILVKICIIIDKNKNFRRARKLLHISWNKSNATIFKCLT